MIEAISTRAEFALPTLKAGERFVVGRPAGSGDSLLLSKLALRERRQGHPTIVVCADALDVHRLSEELPYFEPELCVRAFPDWETLPYDILSPHPDLVSERIETLYRLMTAASAGRPANAQSPSEARLPSEARSVKEGSAKEDRAQGGADVLLIAASTAMQRLAPASFVAARTFRLRQGQRIDLEQLRSQLALAGYHAVSQVVGPGEFSLRGGLIDFFPTGTTLPLRLDLLDDVVETIRAFDPDSQRSVYPVPEVRLLPGREFPFDEPARAAFRGRWRDAFEGDPSRAALYRDVGNGIAGAGIEYYLPLFFDQTATLADYLPTESRVVLHGPVEASARRFWNETNERYAFLSRDAQRPCLPPGRLYLSVEDLFLQLKPLARLALSDSDHPDFEALPPLAVDRKSTDPLESLHRWADQFPGRVLLVADSAGRRDTISQLLSDSHLAFSESERFEDFARSDARLMLGTAPLHQGFASPTAGLAVVTEAELYAASPRRQRRTQRDRATNVDAVVRDLAELRPGDPVVHIEHGIGRYLGLETLDLGEGPTEFLHLQYANEAKLYVPVAQLHLIGRYIGADPDAAPLHVLGAGEWDRARRRAARQVRDTAAELLNLYATRAARKGHAFQFSDRDYQAFADGFEFEETPDQRAAIEAVLKDMRAGFPMDRLVCGDVGFGKTEVALRAAFAAIADSRQVAVLCPTTLLAEQHMQTFRDRFSQWPVKIGELSRFRSAREVSHILAGLADGTTDIAIGTHKLLSGDVRFARLGLAIIDEEHRFGVRQKERLKALRAEVDVLTLTATPIPRTLALSLEGIRDFSVIATAPQRRLAIKTFVCPESAGLIREACLRELKRGGQIYFLHNVVETIEQRRRLLTELIPEARIQVAHGQMPERELEHVMRDFYQQRFNLLLCTTIIETGIDVPTANTILIHRADRFGLAQLHQLRGRVGRSHHQAYAYLMVPGEDGLTRNAEKRLEAIQNLEELGSGFYLAMHDLEIRGAGEVLGEAQSGNLQEIGFDLYTQMLNAAVRALRNGREPDLLQPLAAVTEINLHTPALLPGDYVADVHQRLSLYKKLASCEDEAGLDALREELIDRFGRLPPAARALLETHRLRLVAARLGIRKIDASSDSIGLQFGTDTPVDPGRVIQLMQRDKRLRLAGPDRVRLSVATPQIENRLQELHRLLKELA
jgi:transcription-repair coupling factor (superfamily II helicase)